MQFKVLYQLRSLISVNKRLIETYTALYYLLPAKEEKKSRDIYDLILKREKLELEFKKCLFCIRNSMNDKKCTSNLFTRFMPALLKLEYLARVNFKGTPYNSIFLGERKYLKKYFEIIYQENFSDRLFEMILESKKSPKGTF